MISVTWHQIPSQKTWTTKYRGVMLEINEDDGVYTVSDVTNGYSFVGEKYHLHHAKRLAHTHLSKLFQEEEMAV